MRIALGLEYNGSYFLGWQTQTNQRGIQNAVEKAISCIAQEPIQTIVAGRTDTGVHALEQVLHFDTTVQRPLSAWVRGVNSHLPSSVRILWAKEVHDTFHARFSATSRTYEYRLYNSPIRPALLSGLIGWTHLPLDIELMKIASEYLIGTHDFSAFRASECQAKSPIRTIEYLKIYYPNCEDKSLIYFEIKGNAFLHHMIRNIVGSLIYVGNKKQSIQWFIDVKNSLSRKYAAPTFMPDGLYFKSVDYPNLDRQTLPNR